MGIRRMTNERVRLRLALFLGIVTGILLSVIWMLDPIGSLAQGVVIIPFMSIVFLLSLIPYRPIGETAAALWLVTIATMFCAVLCVIVFAEIKIQIFESDLTTISVGMKREDVRQSLDKYLIVEGTSRLYFRSLPNMPRTFIHLQDAYVNFDSNGVMRSVRMYVPDP